MENSVSGHVAARLRGFQGRHGDVGGHPVGQRPADHHARAQVDHGGEEKPSLVVAQVGDVAHELVGVDGAREVAAHQVGAGPGLGIGDRGPFPGVGRAAAYPQLAHQFQDSVARQAGEFRRQHRVHEPEPEAPVGLQPHAHHRVSLGGPVVFRAAAREPRVEARAAHAENAGHQLTGNPAFSSSMRR